MVLRLLHGNIHYGWFIFIAICCNQFACYQTAYNSLFVLPLAHALGISRSAVLLFMTFYAITYFIASPLWGSLLQNKNVSIRAVMTTGVSCVLIACILFATATTPWMLYAAGVFNALGMTGTKILATTTFSSNWFAANVRGKLMGIAVCFQGIAGIVMPIIIQLIINNFGYRAGYLFLFMMAAVFMLPWALFVYVRTPKEMGLRPLGLKTDNEALLVDADLDRGVSFKTARRSVPFFVIIIIVLLLSTGGGYESSFSGFADEFLAGTRWMADAAMIAAIMLSVDCVFDFLGNITIGVVIDRFGTKPALYIWLSLYSCFFITMLFFGGSPLGLYVAAAFYGFNGSIMRNAIPLLIRDIFGPKDHSKIYGAIQSVKGLTNGITTTMIAVFYDIGGSYYGTLVIGLGLLALCFVFVAIALRYLNRFHWRENASQQ